MDPYFDVKAEVETSLVSLSSLLSSYLRLSRTPTSPPDETAWALSELKATMSSLENDLEELEESVQAVEEAGVARRLGVRDSEVRDRRAFVERVRGEIEGTRAALGANASPSLATRKRYSAAGTRNGAAYPSSSYEWGPEPSTSSALEPDPVDEYEMQHQSLLMEQQDRTLTDISGTVSLLREQAKVMGREVIDQNAMLEDLEHHVDRTSSRLEKAQRRMSHFIQQNQSSPSSWCILILIIVLTVLLVAIVFF